MDVLFRMNICIRDLGLCTLGLGGYRGNGGQKVWNKNAQNGFTLGTLFALSQLPCKSFSLSFFNPKKPGGGEGESTNQSDDCLPFLNFSIKSQILEFNSEKRLFSAFFCERYKVCVAQKLYISEFFIQLFLPGPWPIWQLPKTAISTSATSIGYQILAE